MVSWQAGAHQPDSVAASVIAFDVLFQAVGQRMTIAAPVGVVGDTTVSSRGGGFADRLGSRRPLVDAMVAESAARNRAAAAGIDPDDEREVAESARVVSMTRYLSRRVAGSGPTPLGPGYDPLTGFGDG